MDYIVAPQWYGANKNTMEISHFQLFQSLTSISMNAYIAEPDSRLPMFNF